MQLTSRSCVALIAIFSLLFFAQACQTTLKKENETLRAQILSLDQDQKENEARINTLNADQERLNLELEECKKGLTQMTEKYNAANDAYNEQVEKNKDMAAKFEKHIENMNILVDKRDALAVENEKLQGECKQARDKVDALDAKIRELMEENEKLKAEMAKHEPPAHAPVK